ncbi:unnamed protein product [Rhodiola kirilowii]
MQGHRSAVGSSTGTIDFDHVAAPSSGVVGPELFWSDQSLTEILPSTGNSGVLHFGSTGAGAHNLSLWSQGEASSSSAQNTAGSSEQKLENGWPSGTLNSETVTGFEEWFHTPTHLSQVNSIPNFGPLTLLGSSGEASLRNQLTSSAGASSQNLNLNVRVSGQSDDQIQLIDSNNSYRSSFSGNVQRPINADTHSFVTPGNGSHSIGDNARRFGGSHDAGRLSCKRKFIDEDIGQSSTSGSTRSYQHTEGSSWHPIPVDDSDSNLNMTGSHGYSHPMYGLSSNSPRGIISESLPDVSQVDNGRNNTRNLRLRLNSSAQSSAPIIIGSADSAFMPANDGGPQHLNPSLPPLLSFMAAPEISNQQTQTASAHASRPRNGHSFRRSRGSSSRSANSSGVVIGERGGSEDAQHTEATLRMSRQLLEHHMRAHQLIQVSRSRNLSASHRASNSNSATIIPANPTPDLVTIPSLSSEANASANAPAGRTWGPGHNFASGQRIAEIVRRSVVSAGGPSYANSSNNQSLPISGASSSSRQPIGVSGIHGQGNQLAHRRLALLMQRRGHGLAGIPYSMQSLGAAGDDRSRLLSEIWSALDTMRRGAPLRPEDMMILDQSGLFGIAAELHDRHRDMRLDVDNMSYEELLALEERIGNVNTGMNEEAVMKCLKQHTFAPATTPSEEETEPCCICQEEYNEGENVGILDCGHNFHTVCVKQWLLVKNLCPICKTTGLASR